MGTLIVDHVVIMTPYCRFTNHNSYGWLGWPLSSPLAGSSHYFSVGTGSNMFDIIPYIYM